MGKQAYAGPLERLDDHLWRIPKSYKRGMRVDGLIYANEKLIQQIRNDIQERLGKAGVEVIEARISHLAYSPEIAAAMLQRQQAQAVVAARTKIVEGAVGMVEMALTELTQKQIVDLPADEKSRLVSNLLVVLCSDRHTQPVVNTGSLYT